MKYVRTLFDHELPLYEKHLLNLDEEDKRFRFCGLVTDESIKNHCNKLSLLNPPNDPDYTIIGTFEEYKLVACSCMIWGKNDNTVELAITVDKEEQNKGNGLELLKRSIVSCSNRGVTRIYLYCIPENKRMIRLVSKLGMTIERDIGECLAYMEVPEISYASFWKEIFQEYFGNLLYTKSSFKKFVVDLI